MPLAKSCARAPKGKSSRKSELLDMYDFLTGVDDEDDARSFKTKVIRSISSSVFVFNYGPYEFRGVIAHRKNRILGLAKKVQNDIGLKVYLKPIELFDRLIIEMDDFPVFTCKITNMKFDNDCLDYTSQLGYLKCVEAVTSLKREIVRGNEPYVDPIALMTKSIY